jgi:TM2 domain-containing membrane protein YozV
MTQAGIAAVVSLMLPGAGRIYNGDFLRGVFWLIVTPGLWTGSGGTLGWICHVIASHTATQEVASTCVVSLEQPHKPLMSARTSRTGQI